MREGVEDGAFEHGGAHLCEERGHGWRGDEVGLGGVEVLPLIFWEGAEHSRSRYPSAAERAEWARAAGLADGAPAA